MTPTAAKLIHNFNRLIFNPIIFLMFAAALLVFIWGVFVYAKDSDSSEARETGRRNMIWGIFGMFIMISVFGIIQLVMGTFGISNAGIKEIIP